MGASRIAQGQIERLGRPASAADLTLNMRNVLLPFVLLGVLLASAAGQADLKSNPRVSVAEIEGVRLEVEQPAYKNEVRIRIRDYVARNHQKKSISCELYSVGDTGKVRRIKAVCLRQTAPDSGDYSGSLSNRHEFEHKNIVNVVYKGDGLWLPISTWYVFYYH